MEHSKFDPFLSTDLATDKHSSQGNLTKGEGSVQWTPLHLDQLLFLLKILFTFLTKQATLMRRLTVLSLPPQLVFPDLAYSALPSMTNKQVL